MTSRPWFVALLLMVLPACLVARTRDDEWAKVNAAIEQRLPKTALEHLEPIITAALADRNYAEAARAIAREVVLEGELEGNRAPERIRRLETKIAHAPATMKPVLEAILAHWYWTYFQENRWRFMQRTPTGSPAGADLESWDLTRILAEIDRHFTAALANEAFLKKTPIAEFTDLLPPGSAPDRYRPTLFDFLVYDALQFYEAAETGAVSAEDPFALDADGPIFAPAEAFLKWQPVAADTSAPLLKAVRLYQALLRFHQADADRAAYFDADFARLRLGANSAQGETKAERYESALKELLTRTGSHEISSRLLAALAQKALDENEPGRAHALARRGASGFRSTAGAVMCLNLIQQIEAPSAVLHTEYVWNAPWPTLDVTYRNTTRVHFRAVAVPFEEHVRQATWNIGQFSEAQRDQLLRSPPAAAWSADLPRTADFKPRTERLAAPTTLKPGYYVIFASHDAGFAKEENQLSLATIWVSDLALVTNLRFDGKPGAGFVLSAVTGEPLAGATVRTWRQNRNRYEPAETVQTDADGRFPISTGDGSIILLAEHHGQSVSSDQPIYRYRSERERPTESTQTVFFTDRALYRPGQTIHYKGISLRADPAAGNYAALAQRKLEVIFADPNGQEIARASHVTNEHGSFDGVFTAPRDRVTGHMSIQVKSGPPGGTGVSVEEYKRPKFEVELDAPAAAARLGTAVAVSGRAKAYSGAAIGDAKVKWRVERQTRLPLWCWWRHTPPAQAIGHGTVVTAADGSFQVEFTATPDRSVPEKLEPVFTYQVHVDITDSTGETRSATRALAAGYTALQATLSADDWQTSNTPIELTVATTSLDGNPQDASGSLTIHALKQPDKIIRRPLQPRNDWRDSGADQPPSDPANPETWALGESVAQQSFATTATGEVKLAVPLTAGIYRASLETRDRFGKLVTARRTIQVIDPDSRHLAVKLPNNFAAATWTVEPGEKFAGIWGTGYATGRAFVEFECAGKRLQSYWTDPDRTQQSIELPVTEAMRGGVTMRVTFVRENRAYLQNATIAVPWTNKQLAVTWATFRSKLQPGQKETWTATIAGADGQRRAAEMVASLYDASLDQFQPHGWRNGFGVFRTEQNRSNVSFHNSTASFAPFAQDWNVSPRDVSWEYRSFPDELLTGQEDRPVTLSAFAVASPAPRPARAANRQASEKGISVALPVAAMPAPEAGAAEFADAFPAQGAGMDSAKPSLDQISARKNLNETAFFFPHLLADEAGVVKMQFTMPEALTRWKFLGFAHDRDLRAGLLTGEVVTSKDLMVEPNPPRFVREGDAIEFTVKVTNRTDQPQAGRVRLTFADAATLEPRDAALGNDKHEQSFDIPANGSRTYSWRVTIPDGLGFLTYKAVGASDRTSDGEEGFLPVLSRRVLVTESLPLPIRGPGTREFDFEKLAASGRSDTLRHQSLTVQMVSQPAWYAVMALPYLMEFPYECSEQIFSRLYANALARHIANSDPKIRRIFDQWKNTPALDSPLAKNQELKSLVLEETPWLRQANRESESRRNLGLLFDANRLDEESARAVRQLSERQLADGLWAWFPGGASNEYISLTIVSGFGRLRHLGVPIDDSPAIRALPQLDAWLGRRYQEIQRGRNPNDYVPGALDALHLYGRSFFLGHEPIAPEHQPAYDFFIRQARVHWTKVGNRQSEAQLALGLQRFGDRATPTAIVKSLKERSVRTDELGMFWRDTEHTWSWWHAPIETQAMMIEVFAEVAKDQAAVADCQVWLLKQKQTQDWRTTRATADAIYALLLQGNDLLASDAIVDVALGGTPITPEKTEAGTGFYERKFVRDEIKPAMGHITVKKSDEGVSWGSVHWQYLEDMAKVTAHEATPLTLKKALFVKETTAQGPVLKPVTGPLAVGDELVVRLELRVDREMDYVHLKDQRGSGTEPVNVLSQYKYQDGLGYYESTRDTASHFFIDRLPRGTYVFEYSTRVQLRGRYQSGLAEIQCMYAPEFNSHSESVALEVR